MGRRASSTEGTATGRSGCSDHQSRPARRWPPVCAGIVAAQSTARPMPPAMTPQYVVDLEFSMARVSERDWLRTHSGYPSYPGCRPMYSTNPWDRIADWAPFLNVSVIVLGTNLQ